MGDECDVESESGGSVASGDVAGGAPGACIGSGLGPGPSGGAMLPPPLPPPAAPPPSGMPPSSSSGPMPVVPAVVVAPSVASSRREGGREKAEAVFEIDGVGRISYYQKHKRFECICFRHSKTDERCVLTRTAAMNPRRPSQGRPLGLMMAWLLNASTFSDKAEHGDKFLVQCVCSKPVRLHGRSELRKHPEGRELETKEERPDGADSEPDGMA